MARAGVIGWPVAHSLSPIIHQHWLDHYAIAGRYDKYEVPPQELASFLKTQRQEMCGFNVTLPHKETIMPLLDEIDETARAIGAVNTVVCREEKLTGTNTDATGFIAALRQAVPDVRRGKALVLGAGGAARAAVYALRQAGFADIYVANRSPEKAKCLTAALGGHAINWQMLEAHLPEVDLLVNTTSLGMQGQPPLVISLAALAPHAVVYDIVYKPKETELLKQARAGGHRIVGGMGMLLHQAAPAFELFFGVRPEVTEALRSKVESA